jgi:hypothetical protein
VTLGKRIIIPIRVAQKILFETAEAFASTFPKTSRLMGSPLLAENMRPFWMGTGFSPYIYPAKSIGL